MLVLLVGFKEKTLFSLLNQANLSTKHYFLFCSAGPLPSGVIAPITNINANTNININQLINSPTISNVNDRGISGRCFFCVTHIT